MGFPQPLQDGDLWSAFEAWTADLAGQRNESGIVRSTVGFLHGALGAHRTSLVLPDEDRHTAQEWFLAEEGAVVPSGPPMPWQTTAAAHALAQQVSHVADLRRSDFVDCRMLAEHGLRAAIHAPMVVRGQERGALVVASAEGDGFGETERRIVGLVAAVFAAHHEVERLSERWARSQLEQAGHARSLHALQELLCDLDRACGWDELLAAVARHGSGVVHADRIALVLPEGDDPAWVEDIAQAPEKTGAGETAVGYGRVWMLGDDENKRLPLDRGKIGRSIAENRTLILEAGDLAEPAESPFELPMKIGVSAPVEVRGKARGALVLAVARPRGFSQFDLQILRHIARAIGSRLAALDGLPARPSVQRGVSTPG